MKLATCRSGRHHHAALVRNDRLGLLPTIHSVQTILEQGISELDLEGRVLEWVEAHDVEFLPPVERPDKILCVGINFPAHAGEVAYDNAKPAYPSLFVRFASSQVGHRVPIRAPGNSEQFDFEGELAVVIGKPGRDVSTADAHRLIGGYTCFAENSVRDFQAHSRQVTPGKNFVGSGAFGPWIVTPDLFDTRTAEIVTRLNGVEMQRALLDSMIFSVSEVLAYVSSFTTLLPGDVIAMGTPAGVGMKRSPPLWMKHGDELEVEITGIGILRNAISGARN